MSIPICQFITPPPLPHRHFPHLGPYICSLQVSSAFAFCGFANKRVFKRLSFYNLLPALQDWGTKVRVWDPPKVRMIIKMPLSLGWDSKGMHPKKSKKEPDGGPEKINI